MESPEVSEMERVMEPVIPFDRFGFDYSNQLKFDKQEVADAEKRGMPEAQVSYHLGRIAVMEDLPRPPQGPPPSIEQHQLDCKKDEGSCNCGG